MNKKKAFKKFYLFYCFVLFFICLGILGYVYKCLIVYEKNIPINYVKSTLSNLSDSEINSLFVVTNNYEKDCLKNIRTFLENEKYEIKKTGELTYDIYNGDTKILNVILRSQKKVKELGLLTYDILEKEKVTRVENNGLFSYTIFVPHDYDLKINGIKLSRENYVESIKLENYEELNDLVKLPLLDKYVINNLSKEPIFTALDKDKNSINVTVNNKVINLSNSQKFATLEDANINVDVIKFAENWSLFLSKDLLGTYYGFNTITKYFIKDKLMYQKAYEWSHGIDITFTSKHTLKNPTFTNSKISNVVVYNENAFSCDIYLEKNMVVSGKDYVDVLNNTVYYAKVNGAWKVVNIKAVVE